jgi:glycosyltransferase involved in cell wall biosynthesis
MPFFSFVVPVYNVRKFLAACLESVTSQAFKDWEIILVDDSSTDGGWSECQKCAASDSRMRAIRLPVNSGPGVARNEGLRNAVGEYLYFLDADDTIRHEELAQLHDAIIRCGNPDMMRVRYSEVFGPLSPSSPEDEAQQWIGSIDNFLKPLLDTSKVGFLVWQFAIRRSILVDHQIYFRPAYLGEDLDFVLRCLLAARSVGDSGRVFCQWRTRLSGSLTSNHIDYWDQILVAAAHMLDIVKYARSYVQREWVLLNANFLIVEFEGIAGAVPAERISQNAGLLQIFESNLSHLEKFVSANNLLGSIRDLGALDGTLAFCEKKASEAKTLLRGKERRDIFGFPASRKSSKLLSILSANGYTFKGMLDNNPYKQGLMLDGYPIFNPDVISSCYADNDSLFVVISTSTRKTGGILADQLRGYGLQEEIHFIATGFEMD